MKELTDSMHYDKEYFPKLKEALVGTKDGFRYKILKQRKRCLEVEEQVDFLIEHATDPNILGRLWIGWSSYV
jgi:DNA-dependent protein kinase catalytic subunit